MKPIYGYTGAYSITKSGDVWSHESSQWMKQQNDGRGYRRVRLNKNDNGISYAIHRLVAQTYLPRHPEYKYVNHKNGKKWDNRASNLEWCTKAHDNQHAWTTGLRKVTGRMVRVCRINGRKTGTFRKDQIKRIRILRKVGASIREISLIYDVTRATIRDILMKKSYGYIK